MAEPLNPSDLRNYHIGDIATVTSYEHDNVQKHYEVTGRLLAFRRTFTSEKVQSLSLFIEGAGEIVIPHHVERYFTVHLHRK